MGRCCATAPLRPPGLALALRAASCRAGPSGIDSLFQNFPEFRQNSTRIAAFGNTTIKAVTDAGLECNIMAPAAETPSTTMALEKYIKEVNKK